MARSKRRITAAPLDRCLIYYRVSSQEQAREGMSEAAQLEDCRRYAASRGWAIAGEYSDRLSGMRDDRPGYVALVAEARRLRTGGRPVAIVVKWLHRLGRKVLEAVNNRAEL
ncbi:MAG: recombinase family protein, partial [Chloroflexi bacterium]